MGKGEGGEGKGDRDGRESLGARGREGKGVGKRGGEGKFRGAGPQMFFSRTAPALSVCFITNMSILHTHKVSRFTDIY